MLKRSLQIAIAGVLLAILIIPMSLIALAIRIVLGKPILFSQKRTGQHGKLFTLYKFRTMHNKFRTMHIANDAHGHSLSDEARITKFGNALRRASLDELPQLINTIKGDINFIGPRPLLPEYLPLYSKHQRRRLEVKPGITGWAQVNGRNAISWEQRFDLDVWYVDNHSLSLNIKILGLTIINVLHGKGVNQQGYVSMPKFMGTPIAESDIITKVTEKMASEAIKTKELMR